jgi:alkanesulfonate monooxygenase SsuD/methylene tetrahydromethanopterin reductase-like flavin-dependent oxidoreductase (luciferase family)
MKFGVQFGLFASLGEDHRSRYQDYVDLAVEAEQLGFWGCWTTSHHFGSDPDYRPFGVEESEFPYVDYDIACDPMMLLTQVAARTDRLRLGTALQLLLWDHPVRLAERAAMLDVYSGGRLEWGVGKGAGFREELMFDVPGDLGDQQRKYEESLAILEGMWSGGDFEFHGESYDVPRVRMLPRPNRQPAPLYLACASDSAAAFAGARGANIVSSTYPVADLEGLVRRRQIYLDAGAAAGHDLSANENPYLYFVYVGQSDAEAEETGYWHLKQYHYITESHYELQRGRRNVAMKKMANDDEAAVRGIADLSRAGLDQALYGTAETVAEKLREIERSLDLKYLVLMLNQGNVPTDKARASMRRFADEVMPRFATTSAIAGR